MDIQVDHRLDLHFSHAPREQRAISQLAIPHLGNATAGAIQAFLPYRHAHLPDTRMPVFLAHIWLLPHDFDFGLVLTHDAHLSRLKRLLADKGNHKAHPPAPAVLKGVEP